MLKGLLRIPEEEISFFKHQCRLQGKVASDEYNPVIQYPSCSLKGVESALPVAITQAMVDANGAEVTYKLPNYSRYEYRKRKQGNLVFQCCISNYSFGYGIPEIWIEQSNSVEEEEEEEK